MAGKRVAVMVLAVFGLATPVEADECPAKGAVYTIEDPETGEPAAHARLFEREHPGAWSGLGLEVTDIATSRSWSFSFTASNGYSVDYLVPDEGVEGLEEASQVVFLARQADGRLRRAPIPQTHDPAPEAFLVPRLGVEIWYGTSVSSDRSYLPLDVWHRTGCAGLAPTGSPAPISDSD